MPNISQTVLFMTGAFILIVIPGPNILYLVARSIHQGRIAGFVSVLGIEAATVVHIIAATLGLTSLLLSSSVAFLSVKYAGAAYLVYLGIRKIVERKEDLEERVVERMGSKQVFVQAFLVNLLNPKTSLFFLAFLPQFVDADRGNAAVQILSYGLLLVVLAISVEVVYVLLASRLGAWLGKKRGLPASGRYLAGSTYIGLGVATALSGPGIR